MGAVGELSAPKLGPDRPGVEWRIGQDDLEEFLEAHRGRRTAR
jgi:hypothetical protein